MKLRKAKKAAAGGEKPDPVRTHLRNMIIIPEMIGSIVGVYNGKTFNQVGALQCPAFMYMALFASADMTDQMCASVDCRCIMASSPWHPGRTRWLDP